MSVNNQRCGAVLMFILLFPVFPVHGAIEPPLKEIEYCYRIENLEDYHLKYRLIARYPTADKDDFRDPFVPLIANECFARSNRDEIVAVQSKQFLQSGIRALDPTELWKEIDYFNTSKDVLHSEVEVPVSPIKVYDLEDPRKKIEDVFTIDVLDDQHFSLRLAKRIIEKNDGSVQEHAYATMKEGMADPIAPGYEYVYTPPLKSEETLPVVPLEPSAVGTLEDVIINLLRTICLILGVIATVLLIWSAVMYTKKKDHRSRYRNIALFSLLALILIMALYTIGMFVLSVKACCVLE